MINKKPLNIEKNNKNKFNKLFLIQYPYIIVLIGLIIIPMIFILFYGFVISDETYMIKITFSNFKEFFDQPQFLRVLIDSIVIAFYTTIITILIGYPLAYAITKLSFKNQGLIFLLITAPTWINLILRLNGLKNLLDESGFLIKTLNSFGFNVGKILGTNFAIIFGMVYVYLPFMVIPIYTVLSKLDNSYLEASHDLGANDFKTFKKIILPLSLPGVLSGIIMVMLPSATTIVVSKILGEERLLFGNLIEQRFINNRWGEGSAMAIILAVIIMFLVFLAKKLDKEAKDE